MAVSSQFLLADSLAASCEDQADLPAPLQATIDLGVAQVHATLAVAESIDAAVAVIEAAIGELRDRP